MSVNISSELMDYDVILASASPRRKELLSLMCENFRVIPSDCDEKIPEDVTPELAPEYLSGIKCRCIASVYDLSVVIGCDTVVICEGEVLGKPVDEADAIRMLKMLSGKTHHVVTGVTLGRGCRYSSFSVDTAVTFRELSDQEIKAYVKSGEPMDKACRGAARVFEEGSVEVDLLVALLSFREHCHLVVPVNYAEKDLVR